MSSERSRSKLEEKVNRAFHEIFPGFDKDPEEMLERIEELDAESGPIANEAGDVSLHFGKEKGKQVELILVFGDPNAVNSEGYSTAEEMYVSLTFNEDGTYRIGMKKNRHDKKYTKVHVYSLTALAHPMLIRRRHILASRRRTTHKGGARRRRHSRRRHRRSTRKH